MSTTVDFLSTEGLRPLGNLDGGPLEAVGLALGKGNTPLEIVVAHSARVPTKSDLTRTWLARRGNRATPVLLATLHDGKVSLCGPKGEKPACHLGLDAAQAERLCREALNQPDHHAAVRLLTELLPSLDSELPGISNEGLFATHELRNGAPELDGWMQAGERARGLLDRRDHALLEGLGFAIEQRDNLTSILRAGPRKRAVAVLLRPGEAPEQELARFNQMSPVSYALSKADEENLPWVLLLQGPRLRLYPVAQDVGVGRRGRTETYVEVHTSLLPGERAALLWFLFSADALAKGGTVDQLLEESERFAAKLADGLRRRIYERVIPELAKALASARGLDQPDTDELQHTYETAMTLLFRLLFLAYAEDKDLLPFRTNQAYAARSLTHKAQELADLRRSGGTFDPSASHWRECQALFHAVERGNREWGVPPYGGTLFSSNEQVSPEGALLERLELSNPILGPILQDLLLDGLSPIDFRSLGVREFGTIYEGLLESELSIAETDLGTDKKGKYLPAKQDDEVVVQAGNIYLHNRSGERKATGSYFTPSFAVEHLLDEALEPAIEDHLARLDALPDDDAARALFDFRLADIACGSGHFLIVAVDRIERRFANYLHRRPLAAIREELSMLRAAAMVALGELAEEHRIEDGALLRRLIARRCIYGVDLNPIAVELARLAVWIHTFVPGLPLSLLDHKLVEGNSLVGIGTLAEIEEKIQQDNLPLFAVDPQKLLGEAMKPLDRVARAADATIEEVDRARRALDEAKAAVAPARALCDIVTACRLDRRPVPLDLDSWDEIREGLRGSTEHRKALDALAATPAFHFPIAFPEVFLREHAGFDVIVGNPPWDEATIEEHAFWARHEPGLRARTLSQRQREQMIGEYKQRRTDLLKRYRRELSENELLRRALTRGPYPGMGTGDPDLYKAFAWRFWHLTAEMRGRVGVVLPRTALSGKGSAAFRKKLFGRAAAVGLTTLVNNKHWVFPDVHPQWTIALTSITKGGNGEEPQLALQGPFTSRERFDLGRQRESLSFPVKEALAWTDTASLPLLPDEEALEVFIVLRRSPRLDLDDGASWSVRPTTDLHATNDKEYMDLDSAERPVGSWPIYKGESFDLWNPDTGAYYAWGDPEILLPVLQNKRETSARRRNGVFHGFAADWVASSATLPCFTPRVAFRDVARATDSRTVRCALIPKEVFVTNKGPYFVWRRGGSPDHAYLLGVLASLPLDWYARRFVEVNLNFFILNPFPIPRPNTDDPLRRRVIGLAGRLACIDERFADWADAVGVDWGPLEPDEKDDMIDELDAVVAHLYGLTEDHLVTIFETFHEGWDYEARLEATLRHYRRWKR